MNKHNSGTLTLLGISIVLQCLCCLFPDLTNLLALNTHSILFPLQLVTSMLSHAGWQHLIGNYMYGLPAMLYLEKTLGKVKFLELFFLCGLGATMLFIILGGEQAIGSSGAIAGMLGAACCLFGRTKIEHLLALFFAMCFLVPQIVMLPWMSITGVAYSAHIGGALAGILLTHRFYRPLSECKPVKK